MQPDEFKGRKAMAATAALILGVCALLISLHFLDDTDLLWHLKTGEIITHSGPPHKDIFSFVARGREWIDSQWLFQLIIYEVWRGFGFAGLSVMLSVIIAATWLILFALAYRPRTGMLAFLLTLISLWGSQLRFNVRPEILSFLVIAIYLTVLEKDRQQRSQLIWTLVPLQALWSNIEGLWPIGPGLVGAYLLEAAAEKYFSKPSISPLAPGSGPVRLGAVLLCCVLASFGSPYFYNQYSFALSLLSQVGSPSNPLHGYIGEFLPSFGPQYPLFFKVPLTIMIAFSILALALNARKTRIAHVLVLGAFFALALKANRNAALFCMAAAPFTALNLNEFLVRRRPDPSQRHVLAMNGIFLALGATLAGFFAFSIATQRFYVYDGTYHRFGAGFAFEKYPKDACNFLKQTGWKGKIYDQTAMADYLIWAGYPDWQVYVDTRLEVYGREQIMRAIKAESDYGILVDEDDKYQFEAALIDYRINTGPYLAQKMLYDMRWVPVYQDSKILIFFKDIPSQKGLIEKYRLASVLNF
jgi:hypothetical protein